MFNNIKNKVKKFKDKNTYVIPGGTGDGIYAGNSYQLIQSIENGETTYEEALKEVSKIFDDSKRLKKLEEFNQNQADSLNTLLLVDKIFTGRTKEYKIIDGEYKFTEQKTSQEESDITTQQLDEGSDSTDMPDLESKESAAK